MKDDLPKEWRWVAGITILVVVLLFWSSRYFDRWPASGEDCKQLGYTLVDGPCREAGSPENMQATLDWITEYDRQKATSVSATATAGAPEFYLENDGIRIYGYRDPETGARIYICKDPTNHIVECRIVP